jgi:histidyl-tRNA synthetase
MKKKSEIMKAIRGMNDIMPPESSLWHEVEETAHKVFSTYGYEEIRTPIVEATDLFVRTVGETTAIVEKEMYSFTDRSGDPVSLRPEGTASVVRAYIESGAAVSDPVSRYYYKGPMFRYERPQKGRQRQFHQIGLELLGVDSPFADVEVISTFAHLLSELKIKDVTLEINSIGCNDCRPAYNRDLIKFLQRSSDKLCGDCRRRLEKNPMRVFDCKNEVCIEKLKEGPGISRYWCKTCTDHFGGVKNGLSVLNIQFKLNEKIVRGLDYYIRTAFEFTCARLGSQNAVAAGGRYDGLVSDLGGPDVPGVGYAIGVERLILLMEQHHGKPRRKEDLVYFAVLGEKVAEKILPTIQTLRKDGVRVEWDFGAKSLKAQMRRADKLGAESVVIIGPDEFVKGHAMVRDMRAKTQHEVKLDQLPMHFISIGG